MRHHIVLSQCIIESESPHEYEGGGRVLRLRELEGESDGVRADSCLAIRKGVDCGREVDDFVISLMSVEEVKRFAFSPHAFLSSHNLDLELNGFYWVVNIKLNDSFYEMLRKEKALRLEFQVDGSRGGGGRMRRYQSQEGVLSSHLIYLYLALFPEIRRLLLNREH